MSERAINPAAAEIMVKETQTMIHATKTLFYALQVKGIADFADVDAAAFSFAMTVHSIIVAPSFYVPYRSVQIRPRFA
ncbi:MAG: hypothetical protein IJM25_06020 [Eubacterium sp.]|nr:hypothetical protein [Eubacterium sp.]